MNRDTALTETALRESSKWKKLKTKAGIIPEDIPWGFIKPYKRIFYWIFLPIIWIYVLGYPEFKKVFRKNVLLFPGLEIYLGTHPKIIRFSGLSLHGTAFLKSRRVERQPY